MISKLQEAPIWLCLKHKTLLKSPGKLQKILVRVCNLLDSWNFLAFLTHPLLAGGFNPFEKYDSIGLFPQVGVKIKNIWNHHLAYILSATVNPQYYQGTLRLHLESYLQWLDIAHLSKKALKSYPYHPWDWYVYLFLLDLYGKYR